MELVIISRRYGAWDSPECLLMLNWVYAVLLAQCRSYRRIEWQQVLAKGE
jgi:hypothetical protein